MAATNVLYRGVLASLASAVAALDVSDLTNEDNKPLSVDQLAGDRDRIAYKVRDLQADVAAAVVNATQHSGV